MTTENLWQTEILRITLFPKDNIPTEDLKDLHWWRDIRNAEPDSHSSEHKLAQYEDRGLINDNTLFLITYRRDRIDIVFVPRNINPTANELPSIGMFETIEESYVTPIITWLQNINILIARVAFGARLFIPVNDRVEGYNKIKNYIHDVKIDPDNSSDFTYSINKPRKEKVKDLEIIINRLTKWAVLNFKLITMNSEPQAQNELFSTHVCSLEVDINTSPEIVITDNKYLVPVLKSLIANANEITIKGDIK